MPPPSHARMKYLAIVSSRPPWCLTSTARGLHAPDGERLQLMPTARPPAPHIKERRAASSYLPPARARAQLRQVHDADPVVVRVSHVELTSASARASPTASRSAKYASHDASTRRHT